MKKLKHFIAYQWLLLKSKIRKTKLQYLGKDYFIYGANVIKIDGFHIVNCLSYRDTIMFIASHKFYINGETIIDIENGIKVLFHGVRLLPNVAGYVLNNKQYNANLELMDDGELYRVFLNFIITTYKQNGGILYKIMNLKGEELYTMFSEGDTLNIKNDDDSDYVTFTVGNHSKELHVSGVKEIIAEKK